MFVCTDVRIALKLRRLPAAGWRAMLVVHCEWVRRPFQAPPGRPRRPRPRDPPPPSRRLVGPGQAGVGAGRWAGARRRFGGGRCAASHLPPPSSRFARRHLPRLRGRRAMPLGLHRQGRAEGQRLAGEADGGVGVAGHRRPVVGVG